MWIAKSKSLGLVLIVNKLCNYSEIAMFAATCLCFFKVALPERLKDLLFNILWLLKVNCFNTLALGCT